MSGQPWLAAVPATSGHLSSLSKTLSPSVSGHGQPAFSLGPLTEGQNNFLNAQATGAKSSVPYERVRAALEKTKRRGSSFNTSSGKSYLDEFPTIAGDNYVRARTDAEKSMMSLKKGGSAKRKK
jgi:hypothetical protein